MDPLRFDNLARSLTAGRSRRAALGALTAGTLGLLGLADTAAKQGKGKNSKRKKGKKRGGNPTGQPPPIDPPAPAPPSCAATCASNCNYCVARAAGPPLCGDGYTYFCGAPACSSDNDCTQAPNRPYCITGSVNRATGAFVAVCDDSAARCASIVVC
jgi:hypothetical protein